MNYIAMDTETTLIGKDNIIPDLICSSFYTLGSDAPSVLHWSPKDYHVGYLAGLYADSDNHIILHTACFDLSVMAKFDWNLLEIIWKALDEGRIHDISIREKLINLTTAGSIDMIEQYGIKTNVTYSLAALVKQYLQIDISEEKDAEDSVRVNYESVMHKPIEEWPKEFIEYAGKDAEYTGLIFLEQEKRREEIIKTTGYDPFVKESFIIATSLALQFMTAQGNLLDTERVKKVSEEFITLYNDPELVWPLVHSAFINDFRNKNPLTKPGKLIEATKIAWAGMDSASQRVWAGTGMSIPAVPPEPYAKGTVEHLPECAGHAAHVEYKKSRKIACDCPPKMKAAQPEKGSDLNLHQYVWSVARQNPDVELWLSDGQKEKVKDAGIDIPHPISREMIEQYADIPSFQFEEGKKAVKMTLKVDKEWLATFASLDPILAVYDERHKIQKIVTSYLPCMYWADGYKTACPMIMEGETNKFARKQPAERVHACFAPLKETGRTSSYASKRGKGNSATVTYPSWNGQQVDPRIRQCVVPDAGNVLFSLDYSAMELCTAAQTAFDLLGYEGVLMTLINAGKDTHSYLGAQIAIAIDPEFTAAWGLSADDPDKSYELFKSVQKNTEECDSPVFRDIFEECYLGKKWGSHVVTWEDCLMKQYYKHFRTFGKPTGLGFWGGLGEPTFISMAKATYGITVNMPTAKVLRNIWRTYIPEGQEYLNYVNKFMVDRMAEPEIVEEKDGSKRKRSFYCYDTPLGMHRAKCTYTAAANGRALQSPSAEGALGGVIEIMKECTIGSLAGYVFPSLFVHDEVLGEIVWDDQTTARINVIQGIMKRQMEVVTPNVRAKTEPALMLRWDKRAEEKRDAQGNLVPWIPED